MDKKSKGKDIVIEEPRYLEDEKEKMQSRRKALKKIAVGGGIAVGVSTLSLPTRWVKPIVDKVVVPAHAQEMGMLRKISFWG